MAKKSVKPRGPRAQAAKPLLNQIPSHTTIARFDGGAIVISTLIQPPHVREAFEQMVMTQIDERRGR